MKQEEIEMQLWEYIDGHTDGNDTTRIAGLIATDKAWSNAYGQILAFHQSLTVSPALEQPSLRFTKNVMDIVVAQQISPAASQYINQKIIRGIAALFICLIAAVCVYSFIATWPANTATPYAFSTFQLKATYLPPIFNSTFLYCTIGVNIVLALVLADSLLKRSRAQAGHTR